MAAKKRTKMRAGDSPFALVWGAAPEGVTFDREGRIALERVGWRPRATARSRASSNAPKWRP
jgi:hypothetical protein